jgi:hypothetical protein
MTSYVSALYLGVVLGAETIKRAYSDVNFAEEVKSGTTLDMLCCLKSKVDEVACTLGLSVHILRTSESKPSQGCLLKDWLFAFGYKVASMSIGQPPVAMATVFELDKIKLAAEQAESLGMLLDVFSIKPTEKPLYPVHLIMAMDSVHCN